MRTKQYTMLGLLLVTLALSMFALSHNAYACGGEKTSSSLASVESESSEA